MASVQTELLFELHMDLDQEAAQRVGATSRGTRLIGYIKGAPLRDRNSRGKSCLEAATGSLSVPLACGSPIADHAGLRDRSGEVRLAQPDRSGRCRHPHTDWAQVHGVHHPLSIRGDPKVSWETKGRGADPVRLVSSTSPGLQPTFKGTK
jgi:hypothetical protein